MTLHTTEEFNEMQCRSTPFHAVQRYAMLCNAMKILLGLGLCIGSLCYQPQEHLLAELELPIHSTASEAAAAAAAMPFNAVERAKYCATLCNAMQIHLGLELLHWQSSLPTPRASSSRV
jgi:hypothetical protein